MSKDYNVEAVSGDPQHRYPPPPPLPRQQYPPPQKGTLEVLSNNLPPSAPVAGDPSARQAYPPPAVVEGRPPLACGIGFGWILFILGFLLGVIPWYIGAIILLCSKIDPREKPGCIACAVGAVIATVIVIVIVATNGAHHHYTYY